MKSLIPAPNREHNRVTPRNKTHFPPEYRRKKRLKLPIADPTLGKGELP
jgi:hypothetical protein